MFICLKNIFAPMHATLAPVVHAAWRLASACGTVECQLMGHALVQTESWHKLFNQQASFDPKTKAAGTVIVLQNALDDVADVQNSLANLHLLDKGLNASKTHVYIKALNEMYAAKAAGGFDLAHELEARCHVYFKSKDGAFAGVPSEEVASKLYRAFEATYRPLTEGLAGKEPPRTSWSTADAKDQGRRMAHLRDSVVQLYDDLGV